MSDKELSGEEKRRILKEQFKKDLQQRKEFLKKVQNLRSQKRITQALENMNVQDDTQDWIDKLDQETAFNEAKMDIALDSAKTRDEEVANEEEVKEFVAQELIKQLKREIALETGEALPEDDEDDDPIVDEEVRKETAEEDNADNDRPHRGMLDGIE